jgi:MinD-like ATPase involved in chromosome partitioning or flagellar assembly
LRDTPPERPAHVNAHPATSSDATVLVIASGKGGTGVSLATALLGLAVAGEGRQVLLVDGTESYGALHLMLGVTPRHPLAALRGGAAEAEELLTPVAETLSLFPGGGADGEAVAPLSAAERQLLFGRVAELYERYDLVVVDAGSRLEAVLTACAGGVSRLLLVTSEDRIAMAATHALLKAVAARQPDLPVDVLVNRAGAPEAEQVATYLRDAAARFIGRELGFAGAIPDDPCLLGGLGAGMTVQDAAAGSPAALAARAAGLRLLNDDGALVGATGSTARFHARIA